MVGECLEFEVLGYGAGCQAWVFKVKIFVNKARGLVENRSHDVDAYGAAFVLLAGIIYGMVVAVLIFYFIFNHFLR